jgi:hypothetical protein
MDAKITLSFDESVIKRAKPYAENNNISLSRLTEFFSSIKKIVMDDARIYIETRKLKLAGQLEERPISPLSNLSRFDDKRR